MNKPIQKKLPIPGFATLEDLTEPKQRLDWCLNQITHGVDAFFGMADALRVVREEKLYLLYTDTDGKALYQDFEGFLKGKLGMSPSGFFKLCKASEAYKAAKAKFGDTTDVKLKGLKSVSGLYELSRLPQDRIPEALDAIAATDGEAATADAVAQWRRENCPEDETVPRRGRPRKSGAVPAVAPVPEGPVIDVDCVDSTPVKSALAVPVADAASHASGGAVVAEVPDEDDDEDSPPFDEDEDELDPDEQRYGQLLGLLEDASLMSYVARQDDYLCDIGNQLQRFWERVQSMAGHSLEEQHYDQFRDLLRDYSLICYVAEDRGRVERVQIGLQHFYEELKERGTFNDED